MPRLLCPTEKIGKFAKIRFSIPPKPMRTYILGRGDLSAKYIHISGQDMNQSFRARKLNALQLHQLYTEKGEGDMMCVVRNLHTSRPKLGEVSTLVILRKFNYSVMLDKQEVYRFRDMVLALDPAREWQDYNYISHQKLRSKFTTVFMG